MWNCEIKLRETYCLSEFKIRLTCNTVLILMHSPIIIMQSLLTRQISCLYSHTTIAVHVDHLQSMRVHQHRLILTRTILVSSENHRAPCPLIHSYHRCGIKLMENYISSIEYAARWRCNDDWKIFKKGLKISRESHVAQYAFAIRASSLPQRPAWRFEAHCRHFLLQPLFLFFLPPSLLLSPMHPSSFEGTRDRVRARAGHDQRTNSDWHLLFFSPDLLPFSLILFPLAFKFSGVLFEFAIFIQNHTSYLEILDNAHCRSEKLGT